MILVRSLEELAALSSAASVVTVGNFDGVHTGHRTVIGNVIARARELSALAPEQPPVRSVVLTFDPHPVRVLHPETKLPLITPTDRKLELLAETGLDLAAVLPFTAELSRWSARDFAGRVLCDALHAAEVHEGENFRFGYGAATDVSGLSSLGEEFCFRVRTYEPYTQRGGAVSSSRIRALLADGDVSHARALLGRPFAVRSTPARGRGYGTRYAVPTINLAPYTELLPAHGVYITTLRVGEAGSAAERTFRGVTNAGNRPTFGADSYAVESHLLDFEPVDLNESTPLELTFLHRLRGEQRFPSPDALKAQIGKDVAATKRFFALCDARGISRGGDATAP